MKTSPKTWSFQVVLIGEEECTVGSAHGIAIIQARSLEKGPLGRSMEKRHGFSRMFGKLEEDHYILIYPD